MQSPPKLTDTNALALHRTRAKNMDCWFLHDHAIDVLHERLQEVNRTFTDVVIVGWRGAEWAAQLGLKATCIADTDTLDLDENSYDLIIHALSLHWANDPVGQLVQMRRALRPDGLMIAVMFAGQSLSELRIAFAGAESKLHGGLSPRVAPMGEIRELGALLQRAGFALPVADSLDLTVSYETPMHLMREIRAMGEGNAMALRHKTPMRRDLLTAACAEYMKLFSNSDGRVDASVEIVFLTGWVPSQNQQKPLRPGTAQNRLSEALGVPELNPEKD